MIAVDPLRRGGGDLDAPRPQQGFAGQCPAAARQTVLDRTELFAARQIGLGWRQADRNGRDAVGGTVGQLDHEQRAAVGTEPGEHPIVIQEIARVVEDETGVMELYALDEMRRMAVDDVHAFLDGPTRETPKRPRRPGAQIGAPVDAQDDAAYSEFSTLARAGDERAEPYLDRIRRKLQAGAKTGGTSTGKSSAPSDPGFDMGWSEGPSGDWPAAVTPWNPLKHRPAPPSGAEIMVPFHKSVWVTIFHLPADATVIGLQYVARFLDADRMYRDLQTISRNGNEITLAILAAVWWLLLLRVLYSVVQIVVRLIRVIFASQEQETYG